MKLLKSSSCATKRLFFLSSYVYSVMVAVLPGSQMSRLRRGVLRCVYEAKPHKLQPALPSIFHYCRFLFIFLLATVLLAYYVPGILQILLSYLIGQPYRYAIWGSRKLGKCIQSHTGDKLGFSDSKLDYPFSVAGQKSSSCLFHWLIVVIGSIELVLEWTFNCQETSLFYFSSGYIFRKLKAPTHIRIHRNITWFANSGHWTKQICCQVHTCEN